MIKMHYKINIIFTGINTKKTKKLVGGSMNKYLTCLPVVMLLGGIMWASAKKATRSNLTNKDISFTVYKSCSYKSHAYKNSSAQVHIVIEKIDTYGQQT